MDKNFVNLPKSYRNILDSSKELFNKNNLTSIYNNEISFKELDILHNQINQICLQNECNSYDLNKMINSYQKKNSVVDILKNISKLRNKHIVSLASKDILWNKNIRNLKQRVQTFFKKKISDNSIEKAFIHVLKKYKYDWDGLWSIINLKNGKIKEINLFDIDDINLLIEYLSKIYEKK